MRDMPGCMTAVVTEAACMAHARRKFFDVHEPDNSRRWRTKRCNGSPRFIAIEATIRGQTARGRLRVATGAERTVVRRSEGLAGSNPAARVSGKSDSGRGHPLYADPLGCSDAGAARRPRLPRQQCRGTRDAADAVWGGRTGLFAGSDAGGERAAAIYSLTETAKLNGLDPEDYLRQVLRTDRRTSGQAGP